MNKKTIYSIALGTAMALPFAINADDATPAVGEGIGFDGRTVGSTIVTNLDVSIEKDTKALHLIHTNNDPSIYSKVYILKHANASEARSFVIGAIGKQATNFDKYEKSFPYDSSHSSYSHPGVDFKSASAKTSGQRANSGDAMVEAIQYNDGTNALIISAEDYRFDRERMAAAGGLCIDDLVAQLDRASLKNSSGSPCLLYFPKSRSAKSLTEELLAWGGLVDVTTGSAGLMNNKENFQFDEGLNAFFYQGPAFHNKNIQKAIAMIDTAPPEVNVKCTVYEVAIENDDQKGVDTFDMFNDGVINFGMGSLHTSDMTHAAGGGLVQDLGNASSNYYGLSAQWSTEYLDFLVAKGNASVKTSGSLSVKNASSSTMQNTTVITSYIDGDSDNNGTNDIALNQINTIVGTGVADITDIDGDGTKNQNDTDIDGDGILNDADTTPYGPLSLSVAAPDVSGHQRVANTTNEGYTLVLDNITIGSEAMTLDVNITNTSIVGFDGEGVPRTVTSENDINEISVNTKGSKFVIGGITRSEQVKTNTGIPLLKDIPYIGGLFSTTGTSTKKYRLITVLECQAVKATTEISGEAKAITLDIDDALSLK